MQLQQKTKNTVLKNNTLSGVRVLLVEDELGISNMYTNGLKWHGAEVVVVHDGVHALQTLENTAVDIILLDLMMPRMNGLETLAALRRNKNYTNIPVFMLTNINRDNTKDISEIENIGVDKFLIKTDTSIYELVEHIREMTKG